MDHNADRSYMPHTRVRSDVQPGGAHHFGRPAAIDLGDQHVVVRGKRREKLFPALQPLRRHRKDRLPHTAHCADVHQFSYVFAPDRADFDIDIHR